MRRIGFALVSLAGALYAQPKFEVVSIRPVPKDAPPMLREFGYTSVLPGGQYVDPRTPVFFLVIFAYQVPHSAQVLGLPNWAKEESYSISAKPEAGFPALPAAENRERVRQMMRALLAERFALKLHTETRQEAVFRLEKIKPSANLKEVPAPVPPAKSMPVGAAVGNDGGRIIGQKSTIAGLAQALAVFLKHPVEDQSGLAGFYDFDVKWQSTESAESPGFGADGSALLLANLKEQLGLRLVKTTGPVEYWIVDHVERPVEN